MWSRLASRILLRLTEFSAPTADTLAGVQSIDWDDHLDPAGTMAVEFVGSGRQIRNSHFGALKVKDAIVDQFRAAQGRRPSIDLDRPHLRVHVRLDRDRVQLSLDLAGRSLHRRGYRTETGPAPLKENLAAAVLMRSGWPEVAARGGALVDPMCGTGTLPLEAAWIAGDCAPGLLRDYFGFSYWLGHIPKMWAPARQAETRRAAGRTAYPRSSAPTQSPSSAAGPIPRPAGRAKDVVLCPPRAQRQRASRRSRRFARR